MFWADQTVAGALAQTAAVKRRAGLRLFAWRSARFRLPSRLMHRRLPLLAVLLALSLVPPAARAWDDFGHRTVNQLALASLPGDFPAFARDPATAERITWLASEPDRWRSSPELVSRHITSPDHYIDIEELAWAGLAPEKVNAFRFEFIQQFAAGRAAHPERWEPIDVTRNSDRTREWCGFLPWAITEYYGKLQADIARLKVLEEFGQTADAAQTRVSIAEVMGVMAHFVADAAQPLHTTIHHHGWVGDNPKGYTVAGAIHSWIDGGFIRAAGLKLDDLRQRVHPARVIEFSKIPAERSPVFNTALEYVRAQHALVEPLYQLEKEGKFKADGTPGSTDGRLLIEGQLLKAGEMLGSLWLTAWRTTPPDSYLRNVLVKQGLTPVTAPAAK
jgi:hypothetical protein